MSEALFDPGLDALHASILQRAKELRASSINRRSDYDDYDRADRAFDRPTEATPYDYYDGSPEDFAY